MGAGTDQRVASASFVFFLDVLIPGAAGAVQSGWRSSSGVCGEWHLTRWVVRRLVCTETARFRIGREFVAIHTCPTDIEARTQYMMALSGKTVKKDSYYTYIGCGDTVH